MAIIQFPSSPYLNQTYTVGSKTWNWNGYAWDLVLAAQDLSGPYNQANTGTTIAQSAFSQANNAISNTVLIQSVGATQNTNIISAFTQANNAISNTILIQGVDDTQNTNINSAFTQANNAISNTVLIQGVDNTQNTNISSAFTQANNAISNTVLIQSVDSTQNTNITSAFTQANNAISNTVLIQSVDSTQNTNITSAFTQANSAISNTVLIQGVDDTQNTNISSAFTQANSATTIGQSAFTQANNAISNTVLIQSVNDTQNTNIISAFTQANNAISNTVLIQSVNDTQNTNIISAFTQANNAISNTILIQGVDDTQNTNINSAFTQANSAISNTVLIQGVDNTQNTNINSAFGQANSAYDTANTKFNTSGGNITGAVTISSNLTVTGNVIFSGNVTTISANNLSVKDNMIYLNSDGNTANPDLGVVGNYNDGIYHHAGFFRDASDGIWKVFDNYQPEPDASPYIDTSNSTFRIADFQANNSYFGKIYTTSNVLVANLNSELLNGQNASYYTGLISSAFTQANNAISNTVLIQGVDDTQNTNINSAFTQANSAISNTVLIQSVDNTQNTNITAAFTEANTANINAANASYLSTGTVSVSLLGSGTANANTYLRGDGSWAYVSVSGGGGASVTIANTAPATPTAGNLWWDSSDGEGTLRIYYTDIDSSQWVDATPNPSTNNLAVKDNIIYLNSGGNTANPDLGLAGSYNDGTYHHAGFFRDASDGIWKVFDNYQPEPDASPYIDTSNNTFRIADFQANNVIVGKIVTSSDVLVANLNSELLNGQNASYYTGLISSAFTQANNAISNTVLIQGVDDTQNTNITSLFIQANSAISNTILIQGVDDTQNTNINSAISNTILIQGVDDTQNTNINSAFDQANTANINAANASYLSTGTVSASLLGTGIANQNTYLRGDNTWSIPALPIVLNDISTQFDGSKTVFLLNQEQDNINTIIDSKDLEVVVNGIRLLPYVDTYTYPWLTPYDSHKGFRVKNIVSDANTSVYVGKVIIYNAPYIGDSASLIHRQVTQTKQTRRYPFAATTIALGD